MTRRSRSSRRNEPTPGWVWMLFGFGLGLAVAIGVYLRAPRASAPDRASEATRPSPVAAAPGRPTAPAVAPASETAAPASRQSAPPAEKHFDFYELLPQFEVVVPAEESRTAPKVRSRPIEEPGSYLVQAGSFRAATDAERLRANLALLGIESNVRKVTIDDNVFNRVRIGPISDLAVLNQTVRQLRDNGIEPQVMVARD
jgi:cell division protein FtsN